MRHQLHFLLHCMSHLPSQNLSRFVSFLDSGLEHEAFLLHPVCFVFEDHDLTVFLMHALLLEVHLQLNFLQLLDDLLLGVGGPGILRMQLSLLFLELTSQLLKQLVVLENKTLFLARVLLKALSLALIQFVETLSFLPLFIALILRSSELILQVLDRFALVSLPRLQLRLVDLQLLGRLLLLH